MRITGTQVRIRLQRRYARHSVALKAQMRNVFDVRMSWTDKKPSCVLTSVLQMKYGLAYKGLRAW